MLNFEPLLGPQYLCEGHSFNNLVSKVSWDAGIVISINQLINYITFKKAFIPSFNNLESFFHKNALY